MANALQQAQNTKNVYIAELQNKEWFMLELKSRVATVKVKGIDINYNEVYYEVEGIEIFNRELEIQNDINCYNEYKRIAGLLTTHQVKSIREQLKLTQKQFSEVLGLGEVTIHRIEKGSIQSKSVDNLIRMYTKEKGVKYD